MRQQLVNRPASVLVIAIFHFIFGGVGLLCNLCGLASQLANSNPTFGGGNPQQAKMQADIARIMEKNAPGAQAATIIDTLFPLIFSVMLIAAGIGLLNWQPWGRKLSIAYGFAALIEKVGMALYTILVLLPAFDESMRAVFAQGGAVADRRAIEFGVTVGKAAMIAGIVLPLLYPFVVLLVMSTATVKVWFEEADGAGPSDFDGAAPIERGPDVPYPPRPDDGSPPEDRYRTR